MNVISILILISFSIDCQTPTTDQLKWCPLIQTNGTSKELGIYHRFRNKGGEADFVMFNRAGDEWLFNVTHNRSQEYDIHLLYNTVKHIESNKGIAYRFGLYRHVLDKTTGIPVRTLHDCSVRQRVKIKFSFVLYNTKLLSI